MFAKNLFFRLQTRFLQHFELMAANLKHLDAKFEGKKIEKIENFFFTVKNFHFLRPSSTAAVPHARIAEILITPLIKDMSYYKKSQQNFYIVSIFLSSRKQPRPREDLLTG